MKQKKTNLGFIQIVIHANSDMAERFGPTVSRSLKVTGASGTANILVGLGKLIMGILSLSFFTCVSAFYTFGMVVAKYFAISGLLKAKDKKEQYRYYFLSGMILIVTSLLYIAYSVRLFFYPATAAYHMYVALAIAAFTFTELTINIRGVIIERHNHTPLLHAIKMINLASSLICLVLTQTAILSFMDTQVDLHPEANGLMGILMGICATTLGVIMIIRIRRIQNGKNYTVAFRKVKKLMKKESLRYSIKPMRYIQNEDSEPVLYVNFPKTVPQAEFAALQLKVNQELHMEFVEVNNKSN